MRVITYQAPNGATINLTPEQIADLAAGEWPRNSPGEEFCTVAHGEQEGIPSYRTGEFLQLLNLMLLPIHYSHDQTNGVFVAWPEVNRVYQERLGHEYRGDPASDRAVCDALVLAAQFIETVTNYKL